MHEQWLLVILVLGIAASLAGQTGTTSTSGQPGNDRNKTAQADSLIVELICQNTVKQADAIDACRDFHSSIEVKVKGSLHHSEPQGAARVS
jgi:hypothetical protein